MARRTKRRRANQPATTSRALRSLSDDLVDLRFAPKSTQRDYLGVLLMSLGALALGAGSYAKFFIENAELAGYAWYMVAAGVVLIVAYLLFSQETAATVRVGDLGVGIEAEGKTSRTSWWEMRNLALVHDMLRVKTDHKPLNLSLKAHRAAVRTIVAEALKRIPKRVDIDDEEVHRIGRPQSSDGDITTAEPPQVTNLTCQATDRPLTFEKDVRMCKRCGAFYHRAGVPRRCVECGKKLKK